MQLARCSIVLHTLSVLPCFARFFRLSRSPDCSRLGSCFDVACLLAVQTSILDERFTMLEFSKGRIFREDDTTKRENPRSNNAVCSKAVTQFQPLHTLHTFTPCRHTSALPVCLSAWRTPYTSPLSHPPRAVCSTQGSTPFLHFPTAHATQPSTTQKSKAEHTSPTPSHGYPLSTMFERAAAEQPFPSPPPPTLSPCAHG